MTILESILKSLRGAGAYNWMRDGPVLPTLLFLVYTPAVTAVCQGEPGISELCEIIDGTRRPGPALR
jgi:hypothetical protein